MIRRRALTNKAVIKKLNELETDYAPGDKPFIAFIGKLPDGKYEVVEHIGVGKGKGNAKYKSINYETKVFESKEEYFETNPTWVVIVDDLEDDLPMVDMLKKIVDDEDYCDELLNKGKERMIKNENRD
ncbi:MAG: hypothetical protein JJT76_06925 [Clostridiaceae bacterium]|nr:hypothetical protein [Clostridiaceae bacterium]